MIREQEMIRDKLRFFKEEKTVVHISIKNKGQFYNGLVVSFRGDDGVIIKDEVLGRTLIFLSQIKMVEPRVRK